MLVESIKIDAQETDMIDIKRAIYGFFMMSEYIGWLIL